MNKAEIIEKNEELTVKLDEANVRIDDLQANYKNLLDRYKESNSKYIDLKGAVQRYLNVVKLRASDINDKVLKGIAEVNSELER